MRRFVRVLVVMGCLAPVTEAWAETPVEKGATMYGSQKCGMCHAVAGKGNPKGALDGVGSKLTAEQLRQWIVDAPAMAVKSKATRKPAMKAYTALSSDDVDALVAFMLSLKK